MRITFNHREETAGLTGNDHHYFLDCEVLFSEEEKAIVQTRGLANPSYS